MRRVTHMYLHEKANGIILMGICGDELMYTSIGYARCRLSKSYNNRLPECTECLSGASETLFERQSGTRWEVRGFRG